MREYFKRLSNGQKLLFLLGLSLLLVAFAASHLYTMTKSPQRSKSIKELSIDSTLRRGAKTLSVSKKGLARELGLPVRTKGEMTFKELGISKEELKEATHHIRSHRPTPLAYFLFLFVSLWATIFLVFLGKPKESSQKERSLWYPIQVYLFTLVFSFLFIGFWTGKSPNPMEGIVKVFKTFAGLYPSITPKLVAFAFFVALTLLANKIVCGWACPFGAAQELAYSIKPKAISKGRKVKIPRWLSFLSRFILFLAMLLLLFAVIGNREGYVLYHPLNPFNLFDLHIEYYIMGIVIFASIVGGVFVYRPFCLLICPFGFFSWLIERASIFKVRVNPSKCTKCGACSKACPTDAAKNIVDGIYLPADCFSCSRCLKSCPYDAIKYGRPYTTEEKEQV